MAWGLRLPGSACMAPRCGGCCVLVRGGGGGGELARVKVDFIVFFLFFAHAWRVSPPGRRYGPESSGKQVAGHFITVPAFVAPLNTATVRPRRSDILNINICILPLTRCGGGHSRKTQHGHSGGRKRKSMRTSNNLNLR